MKTKDYLFFLCPHYVSLLMNRKTTISFFVLSILLNYNIYSQVNNSSKSHVNSIQIDNFINLGESVNDLFIDPKIDGRLVAATIYPNNGVKISDDFGITWYYAKLNAPYLQDIESFSLSFNPLNPNIGYLAARVDLMKTTDRGETWDSTMQFTDYYEINYVSYNMSDSNIIFVSNCKPAFYETNLFRSIDGGNNWSIVDSHTVYSNLIYNSEDSKIIYGVEQNTVIKKSNDAGNTWENINNNIASYYYSINSLKINQSSPNILYCTQVYDSEHETWRLSMTTNGGESWERIDSTLLEIDPNGNVYAILLDNNAEGRFYVSYTGGLYLTEDNGKHFQKIYSGEIGKIWSDNKTPATIYFNSDQGLLRFTDTLTVGVEKVKNDVPNNFVLEQNYPNPFNPSTTIKYSIPSVIANRQQTVKQSKKITSSSDSRRIPRNDNIYVTLKVYDILGREVATLVNEQQQPGNYEVTFNASSRQISSGTYFYRLTAGEYSKTMKMILMK